MKLVIKIGGAALEEDSLLKTCAEAVVRLARDGHRVVVVHGGGAALTRTLRALGKKSEFVDGLRVTDAETRDAAVMVLAGGVNKALVAALHEAGGSAFGLCGGDGQAVRASKKRTGAADLGYVGEVLAVDPRWFEVLWEQGAIPVLSSVALGPRGEYYNVNADEMAAACAVAAGADALLFLTDVPGVLGPEGSVLPWLHLRDVSDLVRGSVIAGGMLPKLRACEEALNHGVGRVRILPAQQAHLMPLLCLSHVDCGTEVVGA